MADCWIDWDPRTGEVVGLTVESTVREKIFVT